MVTKYFETFVAQQPQKVTKFSDNICGDQMSSCAWLITTPAMWWPIILIHSWWLITTTATWWPNVVTKFFETFVVTDQHTGHVVTKCSDQICGDQFFETFADWSPHWPNVVTKFCETFVLTDHHNSHVWWPNLLKHLLTDHHTGVSPGPFQRLSFSHTSSYSSFSYYSSYKRCVFLLIFRRDTTF